MVTLTPRLTYDQLDDDRVAALYDLLDAARAECEHLRALVGDNQGNGSWWRVAP